MFRQNFDGTDDYVSVPHNSSLNFAQKDFSVSAWIKLASDATGYEAIAVKGVNQTPTNENYGLYVTNDSNKIRFQFTSSGAYSYIDSNNGLTSGTWYHIVGTYDGSNEKIYINGALNKTSSSTNAPDTNSLLSFQYFANYGLPALYFNGQLDDVKVYNYTLTPTQIKDIYNNGAVFFGPSTGSP
ncbi:LamG domain-containing protein [Patescibacteria group bacterium]|nr:LamG domain-containing protein [Patescibacteria group bacterium]